ncbi:MAG TPA: RNA polymerase factor sigma-32 [Nitrospiria bacterium]|nr:RNA polymerase factor sigma-32 [Nitrospiria bacterium]
MKRASYPEASFGEHDALSGFKRMENDSIKTEKTRSLIEPARDRELSQEETGSEKRQEVSVYDPLRRYLAEIRRYPFLSREEEFELAVAYLEKEDRQAVTRLILSNLRVVVTVAREYRNLPFPLLDLIQEGNLGLLQAIKKFDPYRNVRLATYATWWIRAYILRYILNNWRMVKIGTTQNQRKLFFNLMKEKERLEKLGYDVGPKLLADHLNVREKEVVEMEQRLGNWELSLDEPVNSESGDALGQFIPSSEVPVDERLADEEIQKLFREKLRDFSKALKPRDLDILQNRILAEEPLTLESLSRRYKVSKERIRQLEENLIKKLREYIRHEIPGIDEIGLKTRDAS